MLAGATATAAGLGAPIVYYMFQRARSIPLPTAPSGPLSAETTVALRALVEAIFIAYPVDIDRYQRYYEFHAEKIAGYRQIYMQFTAELDRSARWVYRRSFADCSASDRRQLLKPWWNVPQSRQEEIISAVLQGTTWMQISQYVLQETLRLFMNTDAWIIIGYDGWPGMARGLQAYLQPPAET